MAAVSACEAKQVQIRHLFAGTRRPNLLQHNRRHRIGPPNVSRTAGSQEKQGACGCVRRPRAARQLGAYTDSAQFRYGTCGPPLPDGIRRKPVHRTDVMLVLRHQQRHEHVHIEKRNHGRRLFGAIHQTVNVLGLEIWGARPSRKYRHTTLKTHIRVGHPPEQGFCELVDLLAGLVRQISEACFDLGIHGDGSRWHVDPSKPFHLIVA